jgi:hypothetical protein
MRLDSDVIAWLKGDGRGYQTNANWLLRHAMLNFTGDESPSKQERSRAAPRGQGNHAGIAKDAG